jgi:hypothetical protein
VQRLPAGTDAARKIEHILIFDNHPESLRLLLGRPGSPRVSSSDLRRTTSSGIALLWILSVALMIATCWSVL